jgi:small subunit ribosomal protein S16
MLAIRMQRTGRKGHAMFRVVVQDSRFTPTSGKVVALLGSYDPHTKAVVLDKVKAEAFLKNGAQPSDRAANLLKSEGIKLPEWVAINTTKAGTLRNPEKLRKNQPKEEPKAEEPEAPAADSETPAEETPASEAPAEPEAKEAE